MLDRKWFHAATQSSQQASWGVRPACRNRSSVPCPVAGCRSRSSCSCAKLSLVRVRIEAVLVALTEAERKRLAAAVPLLERIATEL
jgi:hypothetical protein